MSWQYAMLVTSEFVRNCNRAVHVDEMLLKTVIGRMYTRKGYIGILRKYSKRVQLDFDGQWIRCRSDRAGTSEMIG